MSDPVASRLARLAVRLTAQVRARRLGWFLVACAFAIAAEAWVLFAPQTFAVNGVRPSLVGALGESRRVSQTFVAHADGLEGLTLAFRAAGPPVAADLACELLMGTPDGFVPLFRWTERVEVRGRRTHTFAFPPVSMARGGTYRFDLTLLRPAPAALAVEAFSDNALRLGRLAINGQEQWGDLAFRARAASRYRNFLAGAKGLPSIFRTTPLALLVLALYNWAMMAFVYYMIVADDKQWQRPDGRPHRQVNT